MATKRTQKKPITQSDTASRRKIASPKYSSFKLSKRIKHTGTGLSSAISIFRRSIEHIWSYKKIFISIAGVYFLLTLVFVKGFATSGEIPVLKDAFQGVLAGSELTTGLALFGVLLSTATAASNEVAATYQSLVLVIVSLALIWTLRQTYAKTKVSVKEAFYKSMYPLVPFLIILFVIGLQFVPLLVGGFLFNTVVSSGLAVTLLEQILWGALYFLMAILSLYMVSSSSFALYIVALPDVLPMQALRSARELVRYRRWAVLRKVLFLPLILLLLGVVIMLPVILWLTPLAEWLFLILSMLTLVVSHSYLYSLYRELLT